MDKSKRVTMFDVAKAAGVSHQTVSRVINQDARVAPETRERVVQAIQDLNYRPSRVARSLAAKQSRSLSVITYGLNYYGPTQMVINIDKAARQAGYDIFFANVDPADDVDILAVSQRVTEWSVDGLLLIAPIQDSHYHQMLAYFKDIPVLQIDVAAGANTPSVIIDQRLGSYLITKHLLELGHRAIVEIRGPMNWHGAISRHEGFEEALAEYGLQAAGSFEGNWTSESGYKAAQTLVGTRFSAIVAANDQMALGAMAYLRETGIAIPQNVSIVGFDDIPEARYFSPSLSTVRQDFSDLGRKGLEYLIAMIENPEERKQQYVIQPQPVLRGSSQAPS